MMDKKKISLITVTLISVLVVGILIGFFMGKSTNKESVTEPSTTLQETTEEQTTEEEITTSETTKETTTKKAQYREVDETVYATANVNIRKSESTASDVIGGLKKGDHIKRIAVGDNGWSKVTYNGKTAYISSEYLTTSSPVNNQSSVVGDISNTDLNNFKDILSHIIYYDLDYDDFSTSYNYKTSDAFETAMRKLVSPEYYSLIEEMDAIYNWWGCDVVPSSFEVTGEKDPKNLWQQYKFVEAKYADLILETVFNVKPNHDYILHDDAGNICAYYYEDMFYFRYGDGGDGEGPELRVKNVEKLYDGKYKITANYLVTTYAYGDEATIVEDFGDVSITAEMKIVEEKSIWSIYEIKEVG